MGLIQDIADVEVIAKNLPSLISDVEAIVAAAKTQEDGFAKVAALAAGISALGAAVAAAAEEMEAAQ